MLTPDLNCLMQKWLRDERGETITYCCPGDDLDILPEGCDTCPHVIALWLYEEMKWVRGKGETMETENVRAANGYLRYQLGKALSKEV